MIKHLDVAISPVLVFIALMLFLQTVGARENQSAVYVGTQTCMECHDSEYENFSKYAKKAHSYKSIDIMKKGLSQEEFKECFKCHTTGYLKPGGFVSADETPHLKNAGCEVCHGPGSIHVETEDPEDIKRDLSMEECKECHSSERVESFNYKPLIFGGAH